MTSEIDALVALRQFVAERGTQTKAAAALKISQAYLNDLLKGRRTFSVKVLGKLGLRRATVKVA